MLRYMHIIHPGRVLGYAMIYVEINKYNIGYSTVIYIKLIINANIIVFNDRQLLYFESQKNVAVSCIEY